MADLAYGELHAVMRSQEMERRVRKQALDHLEKQQKMPDDWDWRSNVWSTDDEPLII